MVAEGPTMLPARCSPTLPVRAAALAPTLAATVAVETSGYDLTYQREDRGASIFANAPKVPLPTSTEPAGEGGAEAAVVINSAPPSPQTPHPKP